MAQRERSGDILPPSLGRQPLGFRSPADCVTDAQRDTSRCSTASATGGPVINQRTGMTSRLEFGSREARSEDAAQVSDTLRDGCYIGGNHTVHIELRLDEGVSEMISGDLFRRDIDGDATLVAS